jgi:hypothetical protein
MASTRFAWLVVVTIVAVILRSPLVAQDARAVIDAASKAMGTANLQAVEYSAASGNTHAVGQAPGPGKPWPRFTVTKYTALINYSVPVMREQTVRIDDENPPRGGGAGPYVAETQQGGIRPIPFGPQTANAVRDGRTENGALQIWLTPHGFLKAPSAAGGTSRSGPLTGSPSRGRSTTRISSNGYRPRWPTRSTATCSSKRSIPNIATWPASSFRCVSSNGRAAFRPWS